MITSKYKGCEGTIRFAPEERRLNLNPPTTPDTKQWPSVCKIIHRRQLRGRLGEEYRPAPSTRGRRHSSTWQPRLSNRAVGASTNDHGRATCTKWLMSKHTSTGATMWLSTCCKEARTSQGRPTKGYWWAHGPSPHLTISRPCSSHGCAGGARGGRFYAVSIRTGILLVLHGF